MAARFDETFARLNDDQKRAVSTLDGPVLVIAGPGTGKTQVLGMRIANILKETDTDPRSILCLTFQDASVIAMRNRLQSFIGNAAFKVNVHTYHSFCSEIIRSFPHEFNFDSEVTAIKEIDKLEIFKEILTEKNLTLLQFRNDVLGNFKSIVSTISSLKKEYITPSKLELLINDFEQSIEPKHLKIEQRKIAKMRELQVFYVRYLELMQERGLIDFDDMIFKVTDAFATNEDLVKYFQEKYLYTLVDEFQDTNSSQLELIKAVSYFETLESNIFAVGDDDQTIFRFQGANSDNFEKFLKIFPQSEVIVLHTNYRSNQEIVSTSSNVIANNPGRISDDPYFKQQDLNKEFTAFQGRKGKHVVQAHQFEHSFHEDYWIGNQINELVKNPDIKLNEIAVIARNNKQIVAITKFLDSFGIGYSIKRSESILDNRYIQNLLQIFRIIADPLKLKDDTLLWQILSQEFLGIDSFKVFELVHQAKSQKQTVYDYVIASSNPEFESIRTFFNTIIALQNYNLNNSFLNTFTKVIHTLSIIRYLETLPDAPAQVNRLSSLYQFISSRAKVNKSYTSNIFLHEIDIMQERNIPLHLDPVDVQQENKITLLTAHASKGLEYDYVFIYQAIGNKWEKSRGGNDGISLPPLFHSENKELEKEIKKSENEIDERRLFYVAMTRAKKQLYITYSKKYFDSDSGELDIAEKMPSKFVAEAEIEDKYSHEDLIQKHDEITKILLTPEAHVVVPEQNKSYLEGIVQKNLKLSASRLNKYNKCHYKFLLEDIYKLPVSPNIHVEVGSAIHGGIEKLSQSVTKVGDGWQFPDLQEIITFAQQSFESNIDSDIREEAVASIAVALQEIEQGLRAYYDYYLLQPTVAEKSEFVALGSAFGIPISGRIDKLHRSQGLVVTDYKTTSQLPTITEFLGLTKHADKAHLRQLLFYRLLLESSSDFQSQKFAKELAYIRIEYIDTKLGEVKIFELPKSGMYSYKPRSNSKQTADFDIDAEYESLKNELKTTYNSIKALSFERTSDLKICEYCPFKKHCGR